MLNLYSVNPPFVNCVAFQGNKTKINPSYKAVISCFNAHPDKSEKAHRELTAIVPELQPLFSVKQKGNHEFTAGEHITTALFSLKKIPEFHNSPQQDKELMILTVLLHDIAKRGELLKKSNSREQNLKILLDGGCPPKYAEKELDNFLNSNKNEQIAPDHLHPANSAILADKILTKMKYPQKDKELAVRLIKNHVALGDMNFAQNVRKLQTQDDIDFYNTSKQKLKNAVNDSRELKLMYILTVADLKGISTTNPVYNPKLASMLSKLHDDLQNEFFQVR